MKGALEWWICCKWLLRKSELQIRIHLQALGRVFEHALLMCGGLNILVIEAINNRIVNESLWLKWRVFLNNGSTVKDGGGSMYDWKYEYIAKHWGKMEKYGTPHPPQGFGHLFEHMESFSTPLWTLPQRLKNFPHGNFQLFIESFHMEILYYTIFYPQIVVNIFSTWKLSILFNKFLRRKFLLIYILRNAN